MATQTLPTFFISHGGGPWPYMKEYAADYAQLRNFLQDIPHKLGVTPQAVLIISAHWEERDFTLSASAHPTMIYDYSGFPDHTYHIQYPAPGSAVLAEKVQKLIQAAGFTAGLDQQRGFDHGTFVPLAVIYPDANIPVVQLSLKKGLDPREHLAMGRALQSLRNEGVLIIGSGLSYHNLRAFGPMAKDPSQAFDDWLQEAVLLSGAERFARLIAWEAAPAARKVHPREEHLLPLMVAVGAAENDIATCVYHEENFFGGIVVSSFMFGGAL